MSSGSLPSFVRVRTSSRTSFETLTSCPALVKRLSSNARFIDTCAAKLEACISRRTSGDVEPLRLRTVSEATEYISATVCGMMPRCVCSKINAAIDSMRGFAVTSCPSRSRGTRFKYSRATALLARLEPDLCISDSTCCGSLRGHMCSLRKSAKLSASSPAEREVHSST